MKKKSIFWGFILILIAVYVIVSGLGLLPGVSFFSIIFTIVFVALIIDGFANRNIYEILLPLAGILCIYDKQLGITAITPGPVLVAALLCSIGLHLIFKDALKKRKNKPVYLNGQIDHSEDGSYIQVRNTFNELSKYVNTNYFSKADISNSFGQCNVYFNNAGMSNGKAEVNISNSFGEINVYFPRSWRVEVKQKNAFGGVKVHGTGNNDMDAPFVTVDADCSFGEINIFYE